MKTILAPIDFSPVTSRVVEEAGQLAQAFGASVVLLHVVEPLVKVADYALFTYCVASVDEARMRHAAARLAALKETLERRGIAAETKQLVGSPAGEIVAQARVLSPERIVIGSHGHTTMHELFAGSCTRAVLRRAGCPVIVVPAAAARVAPPVLAVAEVTS